LLLLYSCRIWDGVPVAREGQVLAWVAPPQMRDYPMPAADEPLVALLCERF
jgi:8-oxo-dGTP diphosphatase